MKILIATPAYGGNVKSEYAGSLFSLTQELNRQGIEAFYGTINLSEIARARNVFATAVYERKDYSHLLFIDGDIAFKTERAMRLIYANKPFVAQIYAKKNLSLQMLMRNARLHNNDDIALAKSLDFAASPIDSNINNGMIELTGVGMGLCLLHRSVFERMIEIGCVSHDSVKNSLAFRPTVQDRLIGFFDEITDKDGSRVSEDYSFCRRWVEQCGGRIYGMATESINHIGDMTYSSAFAVQN